MERLSMNKIITALCVIIVFTNMISQTTIQMEKNGGVFFVPCKVNGLTLKFIFDTGAGDVSISMTEALYMYKNGHLNREDILGSEKYSTADGTISEGTIINIKTLEFGSYKLYNVKASVVHSLKAPLLLGQTALAQLGKFQFDPNSGILTILGKSEPTQIASNSGKAGSNERQRSLLAKYPAGVTEETLISDDCQHIRRIVIKNSEAYIYEKKIYGAGRTDYFKDGQIITELTYETETKRE